MISDMTRWEMLVSGFLSYPSYLQVILLVAGATVRLVLSTNRKCSFTTTASLDLRCNSYCVYQPKADTHILPRSAQIHPRETCRRITAQRKPSESKKRTEKPSSHISTAGSGDHCGTNSRTPPGPIRSGTSLYQTRMLSQRSRLP